MSAPRPAQWRRLDARMLLINPVRELVRYIPALVGILIAGTAHGGQGEWWSLAGLAAVLALGVSRWATTRYQIDADQIQLKTGLLRKRVITARLDRIRTVDVTAHALHRLLGLARVVIGTGTSDQKKDGLELDGLSATAAASLRDELLHRHGAAAPTMAHAAAEEDVLLRLDLSWLRFAPFTLSGAITGLALLGFTLNVLQQARVDAGNIGVVRSASHHLGATPVWGAVLQLIVAVVLVSSLLAVIGYLLAFYGFRLSRHPGGSLGVTRGLLTTRSTSIEHRRLRGVGVSEPLLLRAAHGARLVALTTGLRVGRGSERGGTVLAPPAPREVIRRTAVAVLDEAGASAAVLAPLSRHGSAALRRRITRAAAVPLIAVVVALVGWGTYGWPGWVAIAGVAILGAAVLVGLDRYRSLGHGVFGDYLVTSRGSLDRRRASLETAGVIGWNVRQTFFQRRAGLVTVTATTAAGRQSYSITDVTAERGAALVTEATPALLLQDPHSDRMESGRTVDRMTRLDQLDLTTLLGQPVDQARRAVTEAGGTVRAVAPHQPVTLDFRPDRVTLVVEDGVVTEVAGIG